MDLINQLRLPFHYEVAIKLMEVDHGDLVLDVGGYDASLGRALTRLMKCEVVAIDIDKCALHRAKLARADYVHLIAASATVLPLKTRCVDKVVMLELLEHLVEGQETICFKEASRVLKNSGILILSTPQDSGTLFNLLDSAWLIGHRHYKASTLKRMLNKRSFKVSKALVIGGVLEVVCIYWVTFWHFIPRHLLPKQAFIATKGSFYSVMPFESILRRIAKLGALNRSSKGVHLFLKSMKV